MNVYQSSKTAAEMEYALSAIPSIGANNHWFIGDQDTGVLAEGLTPYVGENGNWWVGETDSGVYASGVKVTGAEIGQTIVVKAVDENGVPTEWECAELNNSKWRLLHEFTIPEDLTSDMSGVRWMTNENGHVSRFYVASDINGEAFSVKKLEIRFAKLYPQDKATSCSLVMTFNVSAIASTYENIDHISFVAGCHKDGSNGRVSVECLDETGVVRVSGSAAQAAGYGTTNNLVNANPNDSLNGRNNFTAKSIKSVLVRPGNSTIGFYPGGKIKIWGCDA